MFRGHRSIILALVGWLILAASPPRGGADQENTDSRQQITDTLNRVASAIEKGVDPPAYNPPCEDGEDNRRSDLCAQWKAADSAHRSANYSLLFGLLGCVIGGATFAAAFMAAKYAKQAAAHTKTGADEAKRGADAAIRSVEISYAELRAHLMHDGEKFTWKANLEGITIDVILRNAGSTPAHELAVLPSVNFVNKEGRPTVLIPPGQRWYHGALARNGQCLLSLPIDLAKEHIEALKAGEGQVRAEYNAPFRDDFGEWWNFYLRLAIDKDSLESGVPFTEDNRHSRRSAPSGRGKKRAEKEPKLL